MLQLTNHATLLLVLVDALILIHCIGSRVELHLSFEARVFLGDKCFDLLANELVVLLLLGLHVGEHVQVLLLHGEELHAAANFRIARELLLRLLNVLENVAGNLRSYS